MNEYGYSHASDDLRGFYKGYQTIFNDIKSYKRGSNKNLTYTLKQDAHGISIKNTKNSLKLSF